MKNEPHEAHLALAHWQSPAEFIRLVDQWVVPAHREMVRGRGGNYLEAAWVLAQYIKLSGDIERVRLSDPQAEWPDGYIESHGLVKSVEVTEVMEPGRRPNEELSSTRLDPVDDWVARANLIPAALEEGIKRKADQRYAGPVTLLVYLNISTGFLRPDEHNIEQVIADAKAKYASQFEAIIVLWQGQIY